ncbi:uncharacterized protein LOC133035197 [Cannabis sativa]|uniref:uncharacterized protein LOC133035197 n=1 Tax=Cannabis sativa TaxID=3483 RepID=UPI0029CA0227|nr:uncharacterized protein LOC133035197 [Cannabis sativa]
MVKSTEMNALQVQYADKGTVEGFAQDVAGPSVAARHNYETRKKLHFGEQGETEEGETLSSPTDDSDLEWKTGRHYSEEDDDTDEDEGDYVDSDVDLDIGEYYDSDEAGHRNPHTSRRDNFLDPNSNIPNPETDEVYINGKIVLRQFLRFSDHRQFAQVMRDYAVQEGFELQKVKQERIRVTFVCRADACPWRIHASLSPNERLFIIKTFNNTHTCQCVRTNRAANSGWIAKKMVGPISRHPNMSLKGMREELKDTWGIEVNNKRLWRARAIARGEVEGSAAIIQSQLVDINKPSEEVEEEVPPKSRVPIWRPQFQRIFICYNGVKQGFLVGCRPFFGLDGCHLKGPYKGILLSATGLDANLHFYPIAYAIVEAENTDSWKWFIHLL